MALPSSGYIFKVPTKDQPLFGGEALLKLNKITRNNNTNKFIVNASAPNGRKVSGTLNDDALLKIFTKSQKTAPQQFEKAVTRDTARRTILLPRMHSKNMEKIIVMPRGATTANVKARKAELTAERKDKIKQTKARRAEDAKLEKQRELRRKQTEQRQEKKKAIARLSPPPPKKLNESFLTSQLVQRAVATLRDKLSKPNYPEKYVLNLSVLKKDFPENIFNYFKNPKFSDFDSLLSSMFANKPVDYKYKFQNPTGTGIVYLDIIKKMNIDKDDIQLNSAKSDNSKMQDLDFELTNISNFRFSNFEGAEFSFTSDKEREIIDAMKEKQLTRLRDRMSMKLLEEEGFFVKKSLDPYNVLSDALYVKKRLDELNKKELYALKKTLKIKSENTNEIKKKILEVAPDRVRAAEKRATATVTRKRTRGPRKAQIKPVRGRKQKTGAPRLERNTRQFNVKEFIKKADNTSLLKIADFLKLNLNLNRDSKTGSLLFEGDDDALKHQLTALNDRLLMSAYNQVVRQKRSKETSRGVGVILDNNNNTNNTNSKSLNLNSADVSKISLRNLTNSISISLPNVSSAEVPNLSTSKLGGMILKYSMLVAMKQRLEDKMKDTTELMEFIEPYKCVNEFILKQHMLHDNSMENYETTLGCMSEIYSMKHMFKEQKAIIRFASGVTKANVVIGDDPKSFLSQVIYLSGPQLRTVSKLSDEWTKKYGVQKLDKRRDFETEKRVQGLMNKEGTTGPAYEETTFNIYEDIMGYKKGEIKFRGGRQAMGGRVRTVLQPPPKKIRDGPRLEDNPEGHAAHMLTSAYKHGYCMTPSDYTDGDCMESDDNIANMVLNKDFWERRLKHFGLFEVLKDKEMYDLNEIKEEQNCPMVNKCVGDSENNKDCIGRKTASECESDTSCKWKMADCEKHCKRNRMRYCGGINSLVKRMLNYEIPKAKKGPNGGINVNFNKVIVDLASEAKRIKKLAADRKKARPKAQTIDELHKNVKNISSKVNTIRKRLEQKQTGASFLIPQDRQRLTLAEKELKQAILTLNKTKTKKAIGKDLSEEGMQARIKDMTENPAQAFGLLTTIEKERVIKVSDFDEKLKITNGDKQKATTTTTLALIQKGAGAIVPVQHKGKLDHAVVVSMPGGGAQVISQNVLKKTIENNPLSILPLEAGDMVSGVGGMRAVTKGPKEAILEDVFNKKNKAYIDRASSSFKEIVKDLNSSHVVVSDRIERRKNRRSEEFTRKLKFSPLRFINESTNKEDEVLLKYMYKELAFKMESTRQFITKKMKMPSELCDYFDILYNHFVGFYVHRGRRVDEYCNSENIKKLYTIFKTSENIQGVLQNMFSSDRKLREVYQYAADDYFNEGLLNVSSCASKFLLLGKYRHVAINPSVLDKIRDRKLQKEIRKYNPQISTLSSEVKDIKKQINQRELQLEKENNPTRVEALRKILTDAQEDLTDRNRELLILQKKRSRWVNLKSSASKGKVTHIYLDKDKKWKKNDATNGKLKRLSNVNNMTAKGPLSVTSKKGNTMFFKQATLLANYIGYLVAPENAPKEKKPKERKGRKPTRAHRIRDMERLGMSLTASPGLVAYQAARQEKRAARRAKRGATKAKPKSRSAS